MTTLRKKPLTLGGRDLRIAALPFRHLEELKPDIELLMSPAGSSYLNEEAREALMRLVVVSTTTAGNAVDRDFLLDALDIANFVSTGFALFDQNGFIATGDAEPGEMTAAPSQT